MKLYTEEQLVNTIDAIREYIKNYPEKFHESMIEKHLKNKNSHHLQHQRNNRGRSKAFVGDSKL